VNERFLAKMNKNDFKKEFERVDNSFMIVETKVNNAIPAIRYEL